MRSMARYSGRQRAAFDEHQRDLLPRRTVRPVEGLLDGLAMVLASPHNPVPVHSHYLAGLATLDFGIVQDPIVIITELPFPFSQFHETPSFARRS